MVSKNARHIFVGVRCVHNIRKINIAIVISVLSMSAKIRSSNISNFVANTNVMLSGVCCCVLKDDAIALNMLAIWWMSVVMPNYREKIIATTTHV
jgi:hypothetical protein